MSESSAPVSTETAPASQESAPNLQPVTTPAPATATEAAPPVESKSAPQGLSNTETVEAPKNGLDFIPEQYKSASWATKYKTQEDFFKGIEHMSKKMGEKQIVEGLKPPGEDATDEDWNKFYSQIGRPESADKYALPEDVSIPEGYDAESAKSNVKSVAHKVGLTQKQTSALYKEFMTIEAERFKQGEVVRETNFNKVLVDTFPQETQKYLALAKKGAKAAGIVDTITEKGLDLHPEILQLCAKFGELVSEDSFVGGGDGDSKESLLDEALKIQKSPEYMAGDKALHRKVEGIYQRVYDKKK